MKPTGVWQGMAVAGLVSALLMGDSARAGRFTLNGDNNSISFGVGTRWSFTNAESGAPDGIHRSQVFSLDNVRPYISASLTPKIDFELNLDWGGMGDVVVLDAVAKGHYSDGLNVWAGRMLPPSDRANLSGPYFQNAWGFPGLAQRYPNIYAGRDEGIAVWGQRQGGMMKWAFGAFTGRQGSFNPKGTLLYAGRLTLNFWDPEPGYYNSSTYYGAKDVLALGVVGMTQANGAGDMGSTGHFDAYNIDLLMEKNIGDDSGVVSLEGAYYSYSTGGATGILEGTSYFVLVSYLLPTVIALGDMTFKIQPSVRFQSSTPEASGMNSSQLDLGLSKIFDGHNGRMSFTYSIMKMEGMDDTDMFQIGAQTQF